MKISRSLWREYYKPCNVIRTTADDELNFLENIEEPPAGMQVEDSHFPPLQTPASQLPFATPGISNLPEGKDTCLSVKKVLEVPKPDITKRRLSSLSTSSPNTCEPPNCQKT
ncbi:hypothetical protein PGB90_002797 [Kerria lacca]